MLEPIPDPSTATFLELSTYLETQINQTGLDRVTKFVNGGAIVFPDKSGPTISTTYVFHVDVLQTGTPPIYIRYVFQRNGTVLLRAPDAYGKLTVDVSTIPTWKEGILSILSIVANSLDDLSRQFRDCSRLLRSRLEFVEAEISVDHDAMPPTVHLGRSKE